MLQCIRYIKSPGEAATSQGTDHKELLVIESSLAPRGQKRKCRTNSGKFLSLQADYRAGRLSEDDEQRFEAVVADLWRLYKGARS